MPTHGYAAHTPLPLPPPLHPSPTHDEVATAIALQRRDDERKSYRKGMGNDTPLAAAAAAGAGARGGSWSQQAQAQEEEGGEKSQRDGAAGPLGVAPGGAGRGRKAEKNKAQPLVPPLRLCGFQKSSILLLAILPRPMALLDLVDPLFSTPRVLMAGRP